MEFCPHCQKLQNMNEAITSRIKKTAKGKQLIEIHNFHCEVCRKFVKSAEIVKDVKVS